MALRLVLPLLPAWVLGGWLLLTSETVWDPESAGRDMYGNAMAAGWSIAGFLILGTVVYLQAPRIGDRIAVTTSSSSMFPSRPSSEQASFGVGFMRFSVAAMLYLLLWGTMRHYL